MIKKFSKRFAKFLSRAEDKMEYCELYEYATYTVLSSVLHVISIFILGIIFNMLLECLIFYSSFILVRKFAGGYHANTSTRCYLFSVIIATIIMTILKFSLLYANGSYVPFIYFFISVICLVIICYLSPLDTDNKPLNDKEKIIYKRMAVIFALMFFILSTILILLKIYYIGFPLSLGLVLSSILLVMRKLQITSNKH